jgi:hypothetical protein
MTTRIPFAAEHAQTGLLTPLKKLPMQPVPAGTLIPFVWVDPARVPERHRRYVTRHVNRLAPELGVPRLVVRFYAPTRRGQMPAFLHRATHDDYIVGGIASRMLVHEMLTIDGQPLDVTGEVPYICLLETLRGAMLVTTIAHELRHLAQPADMTRDEREADAERFAAAYVARSAA